MRKILREAVIFALLGTAAMFVYTLQQECHRIRQGEIRRESTNAGAAAASDDPAYKVIYLAKGIDGAKRDEAWRAFWDSKDEAEYVRLSKPLGLPQETDAELIKAKKDCTPTSEEFPAPFEMNGDGFARGPDGNTYHFAKGTTKEMALAYFKKKGIRAKWTIASEPPAYCKSIPPPPPGFILMVPDYVHWPVPPASLYALIGMSATQSLLMGFVVGFPAGLGVWILYRLVRFAIKG